MAGALGRCQVCRHSVLNTFAELAGVRLRIPQQQHRPQSLVMTAQPGRLGTFHSTRSIWQHLNSESTSTAANDQSTTTTATTTATTTTATTATTTTPASDQATAPTTETEAGNVPWYLQVETPSRAPTIVSTLLSNYDIPPLPANAPPILKDILEHVSVSIGLSDLRLLDLREVWPPPALGANLLMIIGTARSTKHLNVSADRLCRWLRTKHKLRPYADGLLGRQELKLKLRRRARKMKMAQAVGRTDEAAAAAVEGVTTGWICVNVGAVPAAASPSADTATHQTTQTTQTTQPTNSDNHRKVGEQQQEQEEEEEEEEEKAEFDEQEDDPAELDGDYAGFGSSETSPRIVVQMFTEDKRIEMDLEGLWDFRNTRRSKQPDKVAETAATQETVWREKLHEPVVDVRDGSSSSSSSSSRQSIDY